ncbi:uncharacterized protein BDW43DRAFT_313255 [Aspergillus alliaceus]|uniref:uncharacterized protein n=1 Tax=Petromyces alliaceus TaxID=209559 RepID=UPI0012A607E0|nr:uncharacterized protein BDW43DRAFT_313255 [Aspergillus alliaceus]KAB8231174.1 hypothetical protein BDW43DRAFT_313255 [Aspergillus alliaceus]
MTLIHLRISCFHLCTNDYLNLNKDPPHSPKYYETWSSVAKLQALGLEVMAMLDGELEQKQGKNISFYNGQFYNGFGCIEPTNGYDKIDMAGFGPKRVVAGVLANPANGSKGHLSLETIGRAQAALRAKHHNIGGIMVWEYFNVGQEGETHTCELYEWQCIWA